MHEGIIAFFALIIFLFLLIPFIYLTIKRNSKLPIEKNKKVVYSEYCCAHFDSLGILDIFHNSVSTTRITLYDDFLVISYRRKIILKYEDISSLEIKGYTSVNPFRPALEWERLIINHNRKDISKKISLYLRNCKEFKKILENKIAQREFVN